MRATDFLQPVDWQAPTTPDPTRVARVVDVLHQTITVVQREAAAYREALHAATTQLHDVTRERDAYRARYHAARDELRAVHFRTGVPRQAA